jgi:hypothetical protein
MKTDYMWAYLTHLINHGGVRGLGGTDSHQFGNYMRFANHDNEKLNCNAEYVLYKVYLTFT